MPSATSTLKIFIQPTSLDQRGQNYSVSFEGEIIIDKTRNPSADACRRLVALGHSGRLEVWGIGEPFARLIIRDIETAAALTISETTGHGPRVATYQPFNASALAA
ncbi:hypothetical protein N7E02_12410 [Aliirhizobium terrae]|uniref:hypothetical protein n=1 Tax=Terrirhizobium terrae TaxID=2926709 RepID=UPI0025768542|nr:hypothetical protein [Rhizobium sp. CC-CFT758]WJH41237.1 hypothetical protein N7E02_12410 [Rhizobium sp. CC-CFT758]